MKQRLINAESQTADMIEQADIMQEHRYIKKKRSFFFFFFKYLIFYTVLLVLLKLL